MRKFVSILIVVLVLGPMLTHAQDPGSDTYYPRAGNRSYDVIHYHITLEVDVDSNVLTGSTALTIQSLDDLENFSLDFAGLEILSVEMEGEAVDYERNDTELILSPANPVPAGTTFELNANYEGRPTPQNDPSVTWTTTGWRKLFSGPIITLSEPTGSFNWFPNNEHPLDKATFTFDITVPQPYTAVANGILAAVTDSDDGSARTFTWEMTSPMATYLAIVSIDELVEVLQETTGDFQVRSFFPADKEAEITTAFARQAEVAEFYESVFGDYPFEAVGAVVVNSNEPLILETQTMVFYTSGFFEQNTSQSYPGFTYPQIVIGHEMAHQWFGNSVTLSDWKDIWLNEGFASYAEVLMLEEFVGTNTALQHLRVMHDTLFLTAFLYNIVEDDTATGEDLYLGLLEAIGEGLSEDALLQALGVSSPSQLQDISARGLAELVGMEIENAVIIGDPGIEDMWNLQVYYRGALTLHALRMMVGDENFFTILRTYTSRFARSNVTTQDFIDVAEEVSGQDLEDFFEYWLFTTQLADWETYISAQAE